MVDRISAKDVAPDEDFGGDALDLIEITGVIKWFDVAKGFGFIVPDNGMQDVLLHVTCLRRDGYQTVLEGARIVALIQKRDRGYQAFRILSMDQSTAIHPSQLPPVKTHVQVTPTSGLERVLVKWFNRTKGFGFLTTDDGQEVYLNASALPPGVTELRAGTRMEFGIAEGRKGAQALSARVVDAAPSVARAKRKPAEQSAVIVEDLIKLLDGISNGLRKGRYPDSAHSHKVAQVLRRVADELDA